jgi:hypothetical protein
MFSMEKVPSMELLNARLSQPLSSHFVRLQQTGKDRPKADIDELDERYSLS